jgi:hypothetical protein
MFSLSQNQYAFVLEFLRLALRTVVGGEIVTAAIVNREKTHENNPPFPSPSHRYDDCDDPRARARLCL